MLLMICSTKWNSFESPLLRLPIELRLQIYNDVLGGKAIHIKSWNKRDVRATIKPYTELSDDSRSYCYKDNDEKMAARHYLSIIAMCRQIYAKARHIPFAINTLRLDATKMDLTSAETACWMPAVTKLQT